MTIFQQLSVALLRISLGWYFFWAGITKVLNPEWSAMGFLKNAKMFPDFYAWFASPSVLPVVNVLNEWGLLLVGLALILGVSVRISAICGALLMLLYYFPQEDQYAFIIDDHLIYLFALLVLWGMNAGRSFGLQNWISKFSFVKRSPFLQKLLS